MFDDFFIRALVAGVGVALIAGPLGCFIVWRRLSYFGDTLAHSALLGVALAVFMEINVTLAVFIVAIAISGLLLWLQRQGGIPSDALLGLLSHSALALGLVAIAFMTWIKIDLQGLLFGDILSVSKIDLAIVWGGGAVVLVLLFIIWRSLFAATVSEEVARAEGMKPDHSNIVFMGLMAVMIAISMKIVGVLLIAALLVIPAATARRFASGPEQMSVLAILFGVLAVLGGLFGSLTWDTPSGPSIVVMALALFLLSVSPLALLFVSKKKD